MESMIEVYDDAFSKEYCDRLVEQFEIFHAAHETINPSDIQTNSDDRVMYDWSPHWGLHYYHHDVALEFYSGIQKCYEHYANKYDILKSLEQHSPKGMSLQRTGPRQGYHVWHIEAGGIASSTRMLVYMLYLNDVDPEHGGDTEYLYQGVKVQPKAGRLVLWPSGITHPHRGNPVYKGNKYICTGWYTYDN